MNALPQTPADEERLSIAEVLSNSWDTLMEAPLKYSLVCLTGGLLQILLTYLFSRSLLTIEGAAVSPALLASMAGTAYLYWLSYMLYAVILAGLVSYMAFQSMTGNDPSPFEAIKRVLSRLFELLCFFVLLVMIFIGVGLFSGLAGSALNKLMSVMFGQSIIGMLMTNILALIFIVGFYGHVITSLSLSAQLCVIEKTGAFASLKRSSALTKNDRLRIFGIMMLVFLAVIIISLLLGSISQLITSLSNTLGVVFGVVTLLLIHSLPMAFAYIVPSVTLYQLLVNKENFNHDGLAEIFD